MESAKTYRIERYAMFNEKKDIFAKQFGLNKDLITSQYDRVNSLQIRSIECIKAIHNANLEKKHGYLKQAQLPLF